jgi:hypothetical protein
VRFDAFVKPPIKFVRKGRGVALRRKMNTVSDAGAADRVLELCRMNIVPIQPLSELGYRSFEVMTNMVNLNDVEHFEPLHLGAKSRIKLRRGRFRRPKASGCAQQKRVPVRTY